MEITTVQKWLELDARRVRPPSYSFYPLTAETVMKKTQCLLPPALIKNKNVLDIGCGIPYVELWCNENNASYTGVELQKDIAEVGQKLIQPDNKLFHDSIENFLDNSSLENYDVILCASSLHNVKNFMVNFIKLLESKKTLIFEFTINKNRSGSLDISDNVPQHTANLNESVYVQKWSPSYEFIEYFLNKYNYSIDKNNFLLSQKILPQWFGKHKFSIQATPTNDNKHVITMQDKEWSFDSKVADIFEDHASKHIPDYNFVISSLPNLLKKYNVAFTDPVLDFGCATGKTLRTLRYAGFQNLYGVDNSDDMLSRCPKGIAQLYHTKVIPNQKYKVIICNWTLHFNKNKFELLNTFTKHLDKDGFIILSEKTSAVDNNDYYYWKKTNGVSEEEIKLKEQSLVGKMFLSSTKDYENEFAKLNLHSKIFNNKLNFITWILK